jgi:hypothetical protein
VQIKSDTGTQTALNAIAQGKSLERGLRRVAMAPHLRESQQVEADNKKK